MELKIKVEVDELFNNAFMVARCKKCIFSSVICKSYKDYFNSAECPLRCGDIVEIKLTKKEESECTNIKQK